MTTELENTESTEIVMTDAERYEKIRTDRIAELESMILAQNQMILNDRFSFKCREILQIAWENDDIQWESDLNVTFNVTFKFETKTFEINFNQVQAPKTKIITKSVNADSNGNGKQSIRNRFTVLIDPDGNRHDAPMKNESQNDRVGMETILGFSLLDSNGNSLSHIAKMKLVKSHGWSFESFLDSDQSEI